MGRARAVEARPSACGTSGTGRARGDGARVNGAGGGGGKGRHGFAAVRTV